MQYNYYNADYVLRLLVILYEVISYNLFSNLYDLLNYFKIIHFLYKYI